MPSHEKILDKIALPLGAILTIGLLFGAYFLIKYSGNTALKTDPNEQLVVDVAGAVANPGVYNFTSNQIIEDAIQQAGGLTDQADLELLAHTVNRASALQNHGKIYIPIKGEINLSLSDNFVGFSGTNVATVSIVNINTAGSAGLDTLPGIGPITAGRIIDYRNQKGLFKHKEDIMNIEGIGTAKYAKLKDLITV